ncbi:DUF5798 family protein [Haloarchaeobius litoreus]|uniref:DUF5798 family protein n=1 Tax=Haloarchaeobius litoreus TaxID=755306 RepID=A0ABD6DGM6_9EURY|nr:DUF5798 family protein [Haloarchaeobius litoreus]
MGLGSKAKALQTVADRAEQLYAQLMDIRERLARIEDDIEDSSDRVVTIERELEEQRVILDALAEDAGLDIERRIAEASITHAESSGDTNEGGDTDATEEGAAATEDEATEGGNSTAEDGTDDE